MTRFADVDGKRLEYVDIAGSDPGLLLLHEGLGSVSMWREFPAQLAAATGHRVVAYSREGFGQSSPRAEPYSPRFIHDEAGRVIPALCDALHLERPLVLGHSTGASMALVHAAGPRPVAGVVAIAPLITVEASNLESIRAARAQFEASRDWRIKLARHHEDVGAVFYGWNDTWLSAAFRDWNILEDLRRVRAPVLAILGEADEYSTRAQLAALRTHLPPGTRYEELILEGCGHAPHRERPEAVLEAVKGSLAAL